MKLLQFEKTNKPIGGLLVFFLVILFWAGCEKKGTTEARTDSGNEFLKYYENIISLPTPFILEVGAPNIGKYLDSSGVDFENIKTQTVDVKSNFRKYFKDVYTFDSNYSYKVIGKVLCNNHAVVLIFQDKLDNKNQFSFFLNSFSTDGKFLDSLFIAGSINYGVDLNCEIDSNLKIVTTRISYLPNQQEKTDTIKVAVVETEFYLNHLGLFTVKNENHYDGFYKNIPNSFSYDLIIQNRKEM